MLERNVAIAFQNDTFSVSWISNSRPSPRAQSKRNHIPYSLEVYSLAICERKCVCISGMILFVVLYPVTCTTPCSSESHNSVHSADKP